jgi:hypothetical protein
MKRTVAATLIIALPLTGLLWLSGAVPIPAAFGAMTLFVLVVMLAGVLLLRAADAGDMPLAAAWVLGAFATALAVYALVHWFQLRAATAFAIWAAVVAGCSVLWRERRPAPERVEIKELLGLVVCGAATVLWCREIAEAPEILARQRLLPAWIDYFTHGGVISHFGDPRAGRQSIYLVDFPAPFYHYASYMLPAVFASPLDLPGLPLATSVWLPLGFITMCAGAYALGAALAGPAGGVAALAALTMLPDASNYGLRNGFFSFHWHLLSFPGNTYVVGVFLLSFALLQRWSSAGRLRPLLASACLAGGSLLFRVHVFALGFPAWLVSAALSRRFVRARKLAFFGVGAAAFVLLVFGFYLATDSEPALELFLANVHNLQEPTAYRGWYRHLLETYGRGVAVPAGMLLVLAACLGVFAVLYPAVLLLARRFAGLEAVDLVPVSLIACYVLLLLTAPVADHRDPTELTVRPFVLLYAVIAVWTVAAFVSWLAMQAGQGARRLWPALLLLAGLGFALLWHQTGVLGRLPKFLWGWEHYTYKVEQGLPQAAAFLRRSSRPGDVFAVQGLRLGWAATDLGIQLASLTGMPAYVAYIYAHTTGGGRREQVAMERYAALTRVAAEDQVSGAMARLRSLGIAWYVVIGNEGPRWDPGRHNAAFVEGKIAVYSTPATR